MRNWRAAKSFAECAAGAFVLPTFRLLGPQAFRMRISVDVPDCERSRTAVLEKESGEVLQMYVHPQSNVRALTVALWNRRVESAMSVADKDRPKFIVLPSSKVLSQPMRPAPTQLSPPGSPLQTL